MLTITVENLNDMVVVGCEGRIIRSEQVFELRDAVMAHADARTIVLDLSELDVMGGGGLGMLAFLEHWSRDREIEFKLFGPSKAVLEGLVQNRSILNFKIAGFHEMMAMLAEADPDLGNADRDRDGNHDYAAAA
jgi:anti-anti-sigma regulatory factor